jgi:hypothetical protein
MAFGVAKANEPLTHAQLEPVTWQNISLGSSFAAWDDAAYGTPQYIRLEGWIYLRGLVKRLNTNSNEIAYTPAIGADESKVSGRDAWFPARCSSGATNMALKISFLIEDVFASIPVNGWVSFDGICYPEYLALSSTPKHVATTFGSQSSDQTLALPSTGRQYVAATYAAAYAANTEDRYNIPPSRHRGGLDGSLYLQAIPQPQDGTIHPSRSLATIHANVRPREVLLLPGFNFHRPHSPFRVNTDGTVVMAHTDGMGGLQNVIIPHYPVTSKFDGTIVSETSGKSIGVGPANHAITTSDIWNSQIATLTLVANWSNAGATAKVRRTPTGIVHLSGLVSASTGASTTATTLPVGFRPTKSCVFLCANQNTNTMAEVRVHANGTVVVPTTFAATSLDAIVFPAF